MKAAVYVMRVADAPRRPDTTHKVVKCLCGEDCYTVLSTLAAVEADGYVAEFLCRVCAPPDIREKAEEVIARQSRERWDPGTVVRIREDGTTDVAFDPARPHPQSPHYTACGPDCHGDRHTFVIYGQRMRGDKGLDGLKEELRDAMLRNGWRVLDVQPAPDVPPVAEVPEGYEALGVGEISRASAFRVTAEIMAPPAPFSGTQH